jgi:putative transposase
VTTNEPQPNRRSVRLDEYDYSQPGMYYVTVCTSGRECLFGRVVDDSIVLNAIGEAVEKCWLVIPKHFPHVAIDAYIVMPNHIHGIIMIEDKAGLAGIHQGFRQKRAWQSLNSIDGCREDLQDIRARHASPLQESKSARFGKRTIGAIIGSFKSAATREAKKVSGDADLNMWQRSYYEHIVSSESGLNQIRRYISENPANWNTDDDNPANIENIEKQ